MLAVFSGKHLADRPKFCKFNKKEKHMIIKKSISQEQEDVDRENEARRLLQPSEVNLRHIPNWFRKRLMKVYGCEHGLRAGLDVLGHARRVNDWTWLDHRGSTTWRGQTAFVSEPYNLTAGELQQIADMCERCGLHYHVSANSWWNPGRTIRILIFEPEEE